MSEFPDADYYDVCFNGEYKVIRCNQRLNVIFQRDNMFMFDPEDLKWKQIDSTSTGYSCGMKKYEVNYICTSMTRPTRFPEDLYPLIDQRIREITNINRARRQYNAALAREDKEREKQGLCTEYDWMWNF